VSFTGVKFNYNFLGRGREDRSSAAFRGGGGDTFMFEDPDDAGMVYTVKMEEDYERTTASADEEDEEAGDDGELDDGP